MAASRNPDALDDLIRRAGEDPENCPVTGIPESDSILGGFAFKVDVLQLHDVFVGALLQELIDHLAFV